MMKKLYYIVLITWTISSSIYHIVATSSLIVKSLPGFEDLLPFYLETGYVSVGESRDVKLFYYFVKSERNPKDDPLIVWLTGRPGCSSICGLLFKNGPLAFKGDEYNGTVPTLVQTSYSWTKVANIIYLDSPAGSGFSYTKNPNGFKSSDTKQAHLVDEFLRNWLEDHSEFISNPFYVAGDSYSGFVVPAVVQQISLGNEKGVTPFINLQGYVLGNPLTDQTDLDIEYRYKIPFAYGMGLISDELFMSLEETCGGDYMNVDPKNVKCSNDLQVYNQCISDIFPEHILLRNCKVDYVIPKLATLKNGVRRRELKESNSSSLPPPSCFTYKYFLSAFWANDENVRRALGVKKGLGKWKGCNSENIPYTHDIHSAVSYHANNSHKGFRSLIHSGDHDFMVPVSSTQAWIRSLNYSIIDDWRPWMINNQVAGYTRSYANKMTFVTIKGGGHTAEYNPVQCSILFKRWINGESL